MRVQAGAGRCGAPLSVLKCNLSAPSRPSGPQSAERRHPLRFMTFYVQPHTCFLSCGHVLTLNQTLFIQQLLNETIAIQSTAQEAGTTQQWVQRGINTESHIKLQLGAAEQTGTTISCDCVGTMTSSYSNGSQGRHIKMVEVWGPNRTPLCHSPLPGLPVASHITHGVPTFT